MLNEFLKVAYEVETRKQAEYEMVGLLKKVPTLELRKLADGTPVAELYKHLEKTAHDDPGCFLDRFKGTPLFDQALALEQEQLQAEMLDQQKREERRMDIEPWDVRDKVKLKKRMLELELAKLEEAPAAVPGEPVQGAGAPGPVPAEGVQDASQGLQGGVAKVGSNQEKLAFADRLGRTLAQSDFEKAAQARLLREFGARAGAVMAKEALSNATLKSYVSKTLGPASERTGAYRRGLADTMKARADRLIQKGSEMAGKQTASAPAASLVRQGAVLQQAIRKQGGADYMGLALSKLAVNWAGLVSGAKGMAGMAGGAAKGLGGSLWNYAKANPLKAGMTAAGMAGGVLASGGLQKDEHGQRHLGRAALGAMGGGLAGHTAAGGVKSFMANRAAGQGVGTALGNTAIGGVQNMVGKLNQ